MPPKPPTDDIPESYEEWLARYFPMYVSSGFAERHHEFWRWVWDLEAGVRPATVPVLLWPRGGAKSTSVELGCAAIAARKTRKYVLYVSGKQSQADDHVGNVAQMLESKALGLDFSEITERKLNKFGSQLGWRRNRIRTASGFTIDALGLDVAARGAKLEEQRPDLIVFDDVDDTSDTIATVEKKITAITQKILPAEAPEAGAIFVQNLVHYESVAARLAGLASKPADFLADREVSGPFPAVVGLKTEPVPGTTKHRIVGGTATWEGQSLATCEQQINRWGLKAFLAEAQHERTPPEGQAFPEFDKSVHVVKPFQIPREWPKWRAIDYGYQVPYACLWGTRSPSGAIFIYREDYGAGLTAPEQAMRVRILSAGEDYFATVLDPACWAENREGKRYKSIAYEYIEHGVEVTRATNARVAGWQRLHSLLAYGDNVPPGLMIFDTCHNLIRTLPLMVKDDKKPEDIDTELEDHAPDASRYLVMAASWLDRQPRTRSLDMVMSG